MDQQDLTQATVPAGRGLPSLRPSCTINWPTRARSIVVVQIPPAQRGAPRRSTVM